MIKEISIPEFKVEDFKKSLDRLNKKATKYGVELANLIFVNKEDKLISFYRQSIDRPDEHIKEYDRYVTYNNFIIDIPNNMIMVEGYKLVGILDTSTDIPIMNRIDEEIEIPQKYYDVQNTHCEHCGIKRKRNHLFILLNLEDNIFISVGSSCINDFLGHNVLKSYEYIDNILKDCDAIEKDEELGYSSDGYGRYSKYSIEEIVAYSINSVDKNGYIPTQHEFGVISTRDDVIESIKQNDKISNEYYIKAKEIIIWFKDNVDNFQQTDYIRNLSAIVNQTSIETKWIGYLTSLYTLYLKEQNKKKQNENSNNIEYFGNPGDKIIKELLLNNIFSYFSMFGMVNIYQFLDDENHMFIWKTTSVTSELYKNEKYKVKGTIKEHNEYNGVKQTVITRCKILEGKGIEKK
jgi:hypothetical protein